MNDGYEGPALLRAGAERIPVDVRLTGRLEPVDGRYHWGGRIAPHTDVARLRRAGTVDVTVDIDGGTPAGARLAEVDPWGGVRVAGIGTPPWPAGSEPSDSGGNDIAHHTDVAIVGAGFAGLCAAIRLTRRRYALRLRRFRDDDYLAVPVEVGNDVADIAVAR